MNVCDNCALRLFNNKCYNLQGIGNPWANRVIIVPNVDYDAYKNKDMSFSSQVEVIQSCISSTGELNQTYILPLIRCNENIGCEVNLDIIDRCLQYFAEDLKKYQWKDIMLCGLAANRFLCCSITPYFNTVMVSKNNRRYVVNYSPLIKYIDTNKYNDFVMYLERWFNSSVTNNFDNYETMYL